MESLAVPRLVILAADVAGWDECGLLHLCPEAETAELLSDALAAARRPDAVLALYRPSLATLAAVREAPAPAVLVAARPEDLLASAAPTRDAATELLVLPASTPEIVHRLRRAMAHGAVQERIDASDERSQLRQQSRRDEVTGLPGAWLYRDRLEHALRSRVRNGSGLTVAVLRLGESRRGELDGISPARLRSVATRVRTAIRASDTVAHEGHSGAVSRGAAPELLLLLPGHGSEDPRSILQRIHEIATTDSIDSPGQALPAAIGYATATDTAVGADDLLLRARSALEQASAGEIRCASASASSIETAGEHAVPPSVEVWYQPILGDDGHLVALSAAPRWRHPALGLLGEAELMLFAIDGGLVEQVRRGILAEICAQQRRWREAGLGDVVVTVRLQGAEWRRGELVEWVREAADRNGVPASGLIFEVGEEDLAAEPATAAALQATGATVAVGDFGAGQTALRSLTRNTAPWVKIDSGLVKKLPESSEAMATTRLLLAMARATGIGVVADAVESDRQLRALRALGCEAFQGWAMHAPAPADSLKPLLWRLRRAGQEARVVPFRAGV